jgi:nucleotide-binding universal stress UspA family protein
MDWVKVAVFADDAPEGLARVRTALAVTTSKINVIAAREAPTLPYGYDPAGVFWESFGQSASAAREAAEGQLQAVVQKLSDQTGRLETASMVVEVGNAARAGAALARTVDAVVVAQPMAGQSALDKELMTGALMASGRPCLVMPRWIEPRALNGRAMLAWKGTPEAARAARDALPLLKRAKEVRILCASPGHDLDGEGQAGLERLAAWLSLHGVRVEPPTVTAPPDDVTANVGDAILADASAYGTELLVMGGYGHARLTERVFGGATQRVLHKADCAVLLSH